MIRRHLPKLALLLAVAVLPVVALRGWKRDADLLHAVERAQPARAFAARLSIDTEYRPCTPLPPQSEEIVQREDCGPVEAEPSLAEADFQAAGESSDPDSLRASAAEEMIWWDGKPESLDRPIARLEKALRLSRDPAPLLVDLSAAYLARAERTQNPADLADGLEMARRAVRLEPRNRPALFNTALALELMMLEDQALKAWDAYLTVDPKSPWAAEARRRQAAIPPPAPPAEPGPGASKAEVDTFARHRPQEARLLGQEAILARWGAAVLAGQADSAAALLDFTETLGSALADQDGDLTLADAVREIRANASDADATRALAQAHRAYGAGQAHFKQADLEAAVDSFTRVMEARPPSSIVSQWARANWGAYLMQNIERERADSVLRQLLAEVDPSRHPALVARIHWVMGTNLLRWGRFPQAEVQFRHAADIYERLGEAEYLGFVQYLIGETACEMRDMRGAHEWIHKSLSTFRAYRNSTYYPGVLFGLSNCARIDDNELVAERVQDEGVAVSMRFGSTFQRAEALLARARTRWFADRMDLAAEDVATARPFADSIQAPIARRFLEAELRYAQALLWVEADPENAVQALDAAIAAVPENVVKLLPLLTRRAEIQLTLSNIGAAEADLNLVTRLIRGLSDRINQASIRAAMIEKARGVFDQLVMLHVREGRPEEALKALERGRISFAPIAGERAEDDRVTLAAPEGKVALEYALIGDTLLTWVVRGGTVHFQRATLDRAELLRTIEQTWAALERPAQASAATPGLQRLYDWLIAPVRERLGEPETELLILADGEISGVPFAGLLDRKRGRYLIEDYILASAPSLHDAARSEPGSRPLPVSGLLVADPAFSDSAYPELDRLRGASAEVDSLEKIYPGSDVLSDTRATYEALRRLAPGVDFIHYAGHAVFDDARPERSYLVLAGGRSGRMTAAMVSEELELSRVRLVVLSACQTLRSREGRSGGFAGLSGALLAAGADGVVGSLWRVSDRNTQPLMVAFHREYSRTGDAADALRQAMIQMLQSDDARLRSPATWAGFRYAGN